MTSGNYRQSLERARRDLANAIQHRDFWNLKIVQAQNAVRSLSAMVLSAEKVEAETLEMQKQIGIAQAIEALVNGSPVPISAVEVREGLIFYGYDIDRYANPVSMINQTLERLATGGKVRKMTDRYTRTPFYNALLRS
jgi:hypothetical protein